MSISQVGLEAATKFDPMGLILGGQIWFDRPLAGCEVSIDQNFKEQGTLTVHAMRYLWKALVACMYVRN